MIETLRIPKERKGIFNSRVIAKIKTELGITIHKKDSSIEIDGEGMKFIQAKAIVMAVSHGFAPVKAYALLDEEKELAVIELGKNPERIRARLIGTKGKTRKFIEERAGVFISIQGKTVSLIGDWRQLDCGKKAINMIIDGSKHSLVYKYLDGLEDIEE